MDKGGAKAERGYPGPTRGKPSVTSRHCTKTAKRRLTQTTPYEPPYKWGGDSRWKWAIFRLSKARDLDLGLVILHTVMHQSLTSTYIPDLIEIEELFVDGRTDGHLRPTLLGW